MARSFRVDFRCAGRCHVVACSLAAISIFANAPAVGCNAPQRPMQQIELLFGRSIAGHLRVSEAAWSRFLAREITPRFPDGLTVLDAAGQWRGPVGGRPVRGPRQNGVLAAADGARVVVWQVPPRGEKPVVIYFHGNAEIVASRAKRHRQLTADGIGLVALSYRGYMSSIGSPTEDGLLHDAEAAYRLTTSRFPSSPVVLWGHSLGSGVAVALASRHPIAKVILEAPFSSIADVAAGVFPFVPVRWLMRDQFRSDQRIGAVRAPLLIMHGTRDWVVPIALGERN